jgi:hypothetical protein
LNGFGEQSEHKVYGFWPEPEDESKALEEDDYENEEDLDDIHKLGWEGPEIEFDSIRRSEDSINYDNSKRFQPNGGQQQQKW